MTSRWAPFALCAVEERPPAPRSLGTREGVGDRLRTAAFAEFQAREAFRWAADRYEDAPDALRAAWRALGDAEDRHFGMLLRRMEELSVAVAERPVSNALWRSLTACPDARAFAFHMARAEQRGREAELRFQSAMAGADPVTAGLFGDIAEEEADHIALASRFFPE